MSKYWRTLAANGADFFALYVETYEDAVFFDLSQAENSIIRSVPGDFPQDMVSSEQALAERAFQMHARQMNLFLVQAPAEEIEAIPRCLQGFSIGGTEETCVVVVFQQPSAPHPLRQ